MRRNQRLLAVFAFGLLALVAELVGRSLTHRIDVGRHVATPSYSSESYYPFLLAGVKLGIALLLARLAWRVVRARGVLRAAERAAGARVAWSTSLTPRVQLSLSPRLWSVFYGVTALIYLVQTDAERIASGRWPLLAPWLHTSALPVFAVLAVLMAFLWSVVARWLAAYEQFAREAGERASWVAAPELSHQRRRAWDSAATPRRLFGLAFESRPPPLPA
jgi:hypothetical protein